jgi:uncharacterized protein HemX
MSNRELKDRAFAELDAQRPWYNPFEKEWQRRRRLVRDLLEAVISLEEEAANLYEEVDGLQLRLEDRQLRIKELTSDRDAWRDKHDRLRTSVNRKLPGNMQK